LAEDADKTVRAELPKAKPVDDEHLNPMEESLQKISAHLSSIVRMQKVSRSVVLFSSLCCLRFNNTTAVSVYDCYQ
jgi:hypothetical protein